MNYRILGPLEVDVDGVPVGIVGGKQAALLALLLLNANETVRSERLVEELWDGSPPPSAAKILQNYVSRLRRELGDGLLVTRGRGYELRVEPGELDVHRFTELLEAGRQAMASNEPDVAATNLRAALSLWRGPALAEFADEPFAQPEIDRLEELRLAALSERVEADLALGRHADVIGELESLTARHPFQERLIAQRMLALYRSGRQAEALEVYRGARHALVEQLGIEPGASLQALERAILQQDPALELPTGGAVPQAPRRRRRLIAAGIAASAALAGVAIALVVAGGGGAEDIVDPTQSLGVVDPRTNRLTDRVAVGLLPTSIAVGSGSVWVLNQGDTTVSKIDAATGRLASTIGISEENARAGSGIAYGFEAAWAGEGYAGTVTRIAADTDWGGAEEPIHLYPADASDTLFVATGAAAVWAASVRSSTIYGVDPQTRRLVVHAAVTPTPVGLAVGERAVWVISARPGEKPGALATSGTLARLDPSTAATVSVRPLPFAPFGIAVGFGAVWVSLNTQDSVLRIDPRTSAVEQMIPVGEGPTAVAASDDAIWVVNARSRTISRIDPETDTVVATIPVNGTPSAIASGEGKIWVTGA
jgi:YVTN family beta-propeller protein